MAFYWSFADLMVAKSQGTLSDVLVSYTARLCYVDGDQQAYYSQPTTLAPADPETFIPFTEITEDDLVTFTETTLANTLPSIQEALISQAANPITERQLPWLEREKSWVE